MLVEHEGQASLLERIFAKLSLGKEDTEAVRERKDGAGLVYEFESGRWSLDDGELNDHNLIQLNHSADDDFSILHSRLLPDSTPSATLHVNLPHPHAHFAPTPGPPAYTSASSAIKSKATKPASKMKSTKSLSNGDNTSGSLTNAAGASGAELGPVKGTLHRIPENAEAGAGTSAPTGKIISPTSTLSPAGKAMSMMSGTSRRSKWGGNDAEPFWDAHKRLWLDVSVLSPRDMSRTD